MLCFRPWEVGVLLVCVMVDAAVIHACWRTWFACVVAERCSRAGVPARAPGTGMARPPRGLHAAVYALNAGR